MKELHPADQELVEQGIIPEFPHGCNRSDFIIAARGLRRTTFTGRRTEDGLPVTEEGEIVGQMLALNELRHKDARDADAVKSDFNSKINQIH